MIFATNNKDKLKQIKDLSGANIKVVGLKDFGLNIEIDENKKTFIGNAKKKATQIFALTKECVLADDSGLMIDCFDGWPGVRTFRFLKNSTAEERNLFILNKMKNVKDEMRGARVVCALAFCDKKGKITTSKGFIDCKIAKKQKGENFFGFDSIIQLPNKKTMAELNDEEKEKINARSVAFKKLLKKIKQKNLEIC